MRELYDVGAPDVSLISDPVSRVSSLVEGGSAIEQRQDAEWPHWPGRTREPARRERLERWLLQDAAPERQPHAGGEYLLFASTPHGYVLLDGEGSLPAAGSRVSLEDGDYEVTKLGRAPLPGDSRPCAYLVRA